MKFFFFFLSFLLTCGSISLTSSCGLGTDKYESKRRQKKGGKGKNNNRRRNNRSSGSSAIKNCSQEFLDDYNDLLSEWGGVYGGLVSKTKEEWEKASNKCLDYKKKYGKKVCMGSFRLSNKKLSMKDHNENCKKAKDKFDELNATP